MVHDVCYKKAMKSHGGKWSARAAQQTAKCRKSKGIVRKTKSGSNLKRWEDEKWVEEDGSPCGNGKKKTKKCRPSKRVSKKTPVTWNEMSPSQKKKAVSEKKAVGMGKKTSPIRKSSPRGSQPSSDEFKRRREQKMLYKPFPSRCKHKKYSVYVKSPSGGKKIIHFGDKRYEHYHDKIGYYSSKDHGDSERRKNYRTRHNGEQNDKDKAGWWAWHKLW